MDTLGIYGLRIILAAMICSLLQSLVNDNPHAAALKTLGGILLTITILSPLRDVSWEMDTSWLREARAAGNRYSLDGETMAKQEMRRIIADRTRNFLREEASRLGAELEITVTVGEDLLPVQVELRGSADDGVKTALAAIMEEELSVPGENQIWTG